MNSFLQIIRPVNNILSTKGLWSATPANRPDTTTFTLRTKYLLSVVVQNVCNVENISTFITKILHIFVVHISELQNQLQFLLLFCSEFY